MNFISRPKTPFLIRFSSFLKALWIFSPGIIFLCAGIFLFIDLTQGRDVIYQSTDGANSWKTGLYLVLGTIFWVFTTWYTARLIAYNRDDLYERSPWVLYHFPRVLGFSVFLILWLSIFLIDDVDHKKRIWAWMISLFDFGLYIIVYHIFDNALAVMASAGKIKKWLVIRWIIRSLIIFCCALIIFWWRPGNVHVLLFTLPVLQLSFLFLVIARHPLYVKDPGIVKHKVHVRQTIPVSLPDRYMRWVFLGTTDKFDLRFEKSIFFLYHIYAFIAFVCYLLAVNVLSFAREVKSFPLVMLAFGILLGMINILGFLSYRKQINFNFLLIAMVIIGGFLFETHNVRLLKSEGTGGKVYNERISFQKYVGNWIRWHKADLDKDTLPYPVFFVLADGGASRSGYWVASVLSSMHERTKYQYGTNRSFFMDHLFCLSGASGGSVGNTVFLSAFALQQKQPQLNTGALCRNYLSNDFLVYPLARMMGPDLIQPAFGYLDFWSDRAAALEIGMEYTDEDGPLGKWIRGSFRQLIPDDNNHLPLLSINTTRVNDGGPGVISTFHADSSDGAFGQRIDVLDSLPDGKDIRVSTAMVLGARFPYMSPGGRINHSYYVDGGYFDNSGAGMVQEMILEIKRMAIMQNSSIRNDLKRLRFYVIHLSNSPYTPLATDKRINPVLNDLITPVLTLAGSYSSQTSVNDARLVNYLKEINQGQNSYIVFNLYRKDSMESLPMNWVISSRVRNIMNERIHQKPALDSIVNRVNRGRRDSLFTNLEIKN